MRSHWWTPIAVVALLVPVFASLGLFAPAKALAARPVTTLTFGELQFQPVNGLSTAGITFGFTVGGSPSTDANYNAGGPGSGEFVQDPSLEGNSAGTLSIAFDKPTTIINFGIARSCSCSLADGAIVDVFGPGGRSRGTFNVATSPAPFFSEWEFTYHGPAVNRIVVTFGSPGVAARFALDNLTFARQ